MGEILNTNIDNSNLISPIDMVKNDDGRMVIPNNISITNQHTRESTELQLSNNISSLSTHTQPTTIISNSPSSTISTIFASATTPIPSYSNTSNPTATTTQMIQAQEHHNHTASSLPTITISAFKPRPRVASSYVSTPNILSLNTLTNHPNDDDDEDDDHRNKLIINTNILPSTNINGTEMMNNHTLNSNTTTTVGFLNGTFPGYSPTIGLHPSSSTSTSSSSLTTGINNNKRSHPKYNTKLQFSPTLAAIIDLFIS